MAYSYHHHWHHRDALDPHLVARPAAGDESKAAVPPRPQEPLSAAATRLCEQVRGSAPLNHVARDFPHVVNRIADAWHDTQSFRTLVDSLLISERLDREGFPIPVVMELAALMEYRLDRLAAGRP